MKQVSLPLTGMRINMFTVQVKMACTSSRSATAHLLTVCYARISHQSAALVLPSMQVIVGVNKYAQHDDTQHAAHEVSVTSSLRRRALPSRHQVAQLAANTTAGVRGRHPAWLLALSGSIHNTACRAWRPQSGVSPCIAAALEAAALDRISRWCAQSSGPFGFASMPALLPHPRQVDVRKIDNTAVLAKQLERLQASCCRSCYSSSICTRWPESSTHPAGTPTMAAFLWPQAPVRFPSLPLCSAFGPAATKQQWMRC